MANQEQDLQLPNIGIKITREDDVLKFDTKDYSLRLHPIEGGKNQEYPLLLLDKFITEITTKLLKEHIDREKTKANIRHSLLGTVGEANDNMVEGVIGSIHDDLFGGKG